MQEPGLPRKRMIAELARSPHGALEEFVPIGKRAAREDGEFLAHLVAWNHKNGRVRDSKVALPVVSLSEPSFDEELAENSQAHLLLLDPRNLVRALRFSRGLVAQRPMRKLVRRYLRKREAKPDLWERAVAAHRASMKSLYALTHTKPREYAQRALFGREYRPGSILEAVSLLGVLSPADAAAAIAEFNIPFLSAAGALGKRIREESLMMALIERMSPAQLVTNASFIQRNGGLSTPALRGAFEAKISEASGKPGEALLKAGRAAKSVRGDGAVLAAKLNALQERQLDASAVKGNWLVLGDRSGSMQTAIEMARNVAATLARLAEGDVHLVFFNNEAQHLDATGKTYAEILAVTSRVTAGGTTSIGCGVEWARFYSKNVDGIAIVSDGLENCAPRFVDAYAKYCEQLGKEVPVYLYLVGGVGRGGWATPPFPRAVRPLTSTSRNSTCGGAGSTTTASPTWWRPCGRIASPWSTR